MSLQKALPTASAPALDVHLQDGTVNSIWSVYRTLRDAAAAIGLKPKVMHTLAALLSCLKPGKGMICFASNRELQRRMAGVSDKTIRRHIADLAEACVLRRQNSPNGKRYRSYDRFSGEIEAYGIDLAPMIENASRWQEALDASELESSRIKHLRTKILARLAWIDERCITNVDTAALRTVLRRSTLTSEFLEEALCEIEARLPDSALPCPTVEIPFQGESGCLPTSTDQQVFTEHVPVTAGQNDRLPSKSYTEEKDIEATKHTNHEDANNTPTVVLGLLESGCQDAMSFALVPLRSWECIERHAALLAPMISISRPLLEAARCQLGNRGAALTVLAMVQLQPKVRNMEAYFRSLVTGRRAAGFDPLVLIGKLARACAR